jgi:hypothetical protein
MAYADVTELARVLTLRAPTQEQTDAMQRVLDAAAFEIDDWCGTGTPSADGSPVFGTPYPALVVEVNLERAVEHWSQEESPFGIVGLGSDTIPVATARDSWDRHGQKLAPLRQTWGIG